MRSTNDLVAVDLFAGLGGFSTGAVLAGARVAWAANHWKFCALDTAEQRSAWAKSHGVPGPLSEALVRRARAACERREDNKRLGLPDPIRAKKETR